MNEIEIDQTYLDEYFVSRINNTDDEKLIGIFDYVLQNYNSEINQEKISNFNKIIHALLGNDVDSSHFYRQLKYIINKGCYNRLSKKYKNDLIALQINENKIDIILDIQKNYTEKLNEINKKIDLNTKNSIINDFEIKTEMPVYNTNYKIKEQRENEDIKKQNLSIKLNLTNSNEKYESLVLTMNKLQLINFYEEIEKIQEKLDKLY